MRISDWSSDVCSSDLAGILEDHAGVHGRGKLFPPCDNSVGEGFDRFLGQPIGQTGNQRAAADGTDDLTRNLLRLNRYTQVKPQLEQQLNKHVLLCSSRQQVLRSEERRVGKTGVDTCKTQGAPVH